MSESIIETKCLTRANANQLPHVARIAPVVQVAIVVMENNVMMDVSAVQANALLATNKRLLLVVVIVNNVEPNASAHHQEIVVLLASAAVATAQNKPIEFPL